MGVATRPPVPHAKGGTEQQQQEQTTEHTDRWTELPLLLLSVCANFFTLMMLFSLCTESTLVSE